MREIIQTCLQNPGNAPVHCVGIGGVGMAGIAAALHDAGFRVTGCDLIPNRLTQRLADNGISVQIGHDVAHLTPPPRFVVRSTAVPLDHPEIQAAQAQGIPVFQRGEVWPALLRAHTTVAISGTHGKTTTSALCVHAVRAAADLPGYFIGGEWEADGQVYQPGRYPVFITEADESDGTLQHYHPAFAVITGIDYDHMEHFRDEQTFINVFRQFAQQTERGVIYCGDDPRLTHLVPATPASRSYGFHADCAIRALDVQASKRETRFTIAVDGRRRGEVLWPIPGRYNVQNALAAIAVVDALGADVDRAIEQLPAFQPVRRRFEYVGRHHGARVFTDYAHHPTEIAALVAAARERAPGRVLAIFQPHRYTRTRALGPQFPAAFAGLAQVILVPVYAASESPLSGGDLPDLVAHFEQTGATPTVCTADLTAAWQLAGEMLQADDWLLLIGAGDIEQLALRCETDAPTDASP